MDDASYKSTLFDEDEVGALSPEELQKELFQRSIALLARRDYSQGELKKRFYGKYPPEMLERVLLQLEAAGYQSDRRFAQVWLRHRASQKYGPVRIKNELRQKQLSNDDIDAAFVDDETDWFELALDAWIKKFGRYSDFDYALRSKAYRHLLQRGFSYDQVQFAVESGPERLDEQTY